MSTPNPFDQFDSSGNPFDQFDSPPVYQNNEVLPGGKRVPVGSPEALAAHSPVADYPLELNALIGVGKTATNLYAGAQERYAQLKDWLTGSNTAAPIQANVADQRRLDAPLDQTWGGKAGEIGATVPLAFLPGAGTLAGATAIGAGLGALQPTTANESPLLNTAVGAGTGVVGKVAGDRFTSWLGNRLSQPFMGESGLTAAQQEAADQGTSIGMRLTPGQQAGSKALLQFEAKLRGQPASSGPFTAIDRSNQDNANAIGARSIGISADTMDKTVLRDAQTRFSQIFSAARDPNVQVPIGQTTLNELSNASNDLTDSSQAAFNANSDIKNLVGSLGDNLTAQNLGQISSRLGNASNREITSQGGNRELGFALRAAKEHVDDLIGGSITDPDLAADYAAARPQYRNFLNLTAGKITNPSTGNVNLGALATRLMKTDRNGFLMGKNNSDLYQAASFGQAFMPVVGDSGTATRELGLGNLAMQVPAYLASRLYMPGGFMGLGSLTGPVLRAPAYAGAALGGMTSRTLGPVAPYAGRGLQGLAYGTEPLALPYVER